MEDEIFDSNLYTKTIRSLSNKDSNVYKVTEYYEALTEGVWHESRMHLDEGGIAIVRSKLLNIEKYLKKWVKKHSIKSTIMQPEECALGLINDLRNRGLLE